MFKVVCFPPLHINNGNYVFYLVAPTAVRECCRQCLGENVTPTSLKFKCFPFKQTCLFYTLFCFPCWWKYCTVSKAWQIMFLSCIYMCVCIYIHIYIYEFLKAAKTHIQWKATSSFREHLMSPACSFVVSNKRILYIYGGRLLGTFNKIGYYLLYSLGIYMYF